MEIFAVLVIFLVAAIVGDRIGAGVLEARHLRKAHLDRQKESNNV